MIQLRPHPQVTIADLHKMEAEMFPKASPRPTGIATDTQSIIEQSDTQSIIEQLRRRPTSASSAHLPRQPTTGAPTTTLRLCTRARADVRALPRRQELLAGRAVAVGVFRGKWQVVSQNVGSINALTLHHHRAW